MIYNPQTLASKDFTQMQVPRVSVIIPLYNKEDTIERAIDSILKQSYTDFEIIIVDDGSTDKSLEIVKTYVDNSIVRIIEQENAGPGAARNRGIVASRSELVSFLDADDEWLPDFLINAIDLFDAHKKIAGVITSFYEGPDRISTSDGWYHKGIRNGVIKVTTESLAPRVITLINFMNSWAMVVKRDTILKYGGYYEKNKCTYGEDSYLWLKMIFNESFYLSLEPLVWWHNESSGLSRNLKGMRPVEPFLTAWNGIYRECPDELLHLLDKVFAIRAGKTASVLSFWGEWREGRKLLQTFTTLEDLRYPIVLIGNLVSNPIGAMLGAIIRKLMPLVSNGSRIGSAVFLDEDDIINAI